MTRRAQINDLLQTFDDDITRLTRLNQQTQLELCQAQSTIAHLEARVTRLTDENGRLLLSRGRTQQQHHHQHQESATEPNNTELEAVERLTTENASLREQLERLKHQYVDNSIFCDIDTRESHDSGVQFHSDCDSMSIVSNNRHHNPLDSLLCNEELNNHRPNSLYCDGDTLSRADLAYFTSVRTPTKTPTKFRTPIKFRTPQKSPFTPGSTTSCSSLTLATSAAATRSMQMIGVDTEQLPNITTRTLMGQITHDRPGRTFQLTASGLSSLRVVATTATTMTTPIATNHEQTSSNRLKPPNKPKVKSTQPSSSSQEPFQSPRKLKTINILRRRRASERNKVYETPTRSSRRKQVF